MLANNTQGAASVLTSTPQRRMQGLRAALIGSSLLILGIGLAHTRWGRPILGLFANGTACPVSTERLDADQLETFRTQALRAHGRARLTIHFPALDFELGRTSRDDVERWLRRAPATCATALAGSAIQCADVTLPNGPHIDELHLQFDARGRLVGIDAQHRSTSSSEALAHYTQALTRLTRVLGDATSAHGIPSNEYLTAARFRRVASEYRYGNYLAKLSATNATRTSVLVREQYQFWDESEPIPE